MRLTDLEGIGPVRAETLRAMGISSLRDLLFTLPVRYEDRHTVYPCNTKHAGPAVIQGFFAEPLKSNYFRGLSRVTGTVSDGSGKLPVCWFNEPWMKDKIQPGQEVRLYGRIIIKNGKRMLQNPAFCNEDGLIPVYRQMKGIPAKSFRKLISTAFEYLDDCCPETLPNRFRIANHLCELNFALRQVHFPDSLDNLNIARHRLSFERILLYLLYVSGAQQERKPAQAFQISGKAEEEFWNAFAFTPTKAQKRVCREIAEDLRKDQAMARLVQGDVGCGKTAVAFATAFLCHRAGFQTAMMAPTEILAAQHYENARVLLEPFGIHCRLLTGNTKARERRDILRELKDGICTVVFGTHALISNGVEYGRLGLVITDEQHRFGVNQRSALEEKGKQKASYPHVLVMSATPIPRSLALILYGDLDLSVIDELPGGRKPVQTRIVPESKRNAMYVYLRKEVEQGKQAYIVCPAVEESESMEELRGAKGVYEELRTGALKGCSIALTWGDQKSEEKRTVFQDFLNRKIQVLVSTTVIEVGVNNPNASIMIVENAERFGLSQLHQLRGRVGRGEIESWCFLLSDQSEKLQILCASNDGFDISKKDLEMRGPGDLIGTRQSGMGGDEIAGGGDVLLLDEVAKTVKKLNREAEWKEEKEILARYAKEYFEENDARIALN